MADLSNLQIIQQVYKNYAEGNMQAVLSFFDKDIIWERPGAPDIPFSGRFEGMEGIMKMFAAQAASIKTTTFVPEKFCTNEDTVAVTGHDTVDVIPTGKTYQTSWVQEFTLKDGKIIHVRVYMDTLVIANAFKH